MNYLALLISTVFINNIVLGQFLGTEMFEKPTGNSSKPFGTFVAITLVCTIATLIGSLIRQFVLVPLNAYFLQVYIFILLVIGLSYFCGILLKKIWPTGFQPAHSFSIISTNSLILGVLLLITKRNLTIAESVTFAFFASIAYGFISMLITSIANQLKMVSLPNNMKGTPTILLAVGLLTMALMGFIGII